MKARVLMPADTAARDYGRLEGARFEAWLEVWRRLPAEAREALTHPAWLLSWFHHQAAASAEDIRLFVVTDDLGTPVTVAPLRVIARHGGCTLASETPVGAGSLAVHPRQRDEALRALFAAEVPGHGPPRCLQLAQVDARNPVLGWRGGRLGVAAEPRSVLVFPAGHASHYARLSKNFKSTLRRTSNKLHRLQDVGVDTLEAPDAALQGLDRLTEIDARSWKKDRGWTIQSDPDHLAMLRAAVARLSRDREAVVHVLHAGGTDIAGQLSLVIDDVLYLTILSFDAEYSAIGPGSLLLEQVLREYCGARAVHKANLITSQPWHRNWRAESEPTQSAWLFAPGARGLVGRGDMPCRIIARAELSRLGLEEPVRRWLGRAAGTG